MKFNVKKTIYVGLAFLTISMFWQTYDSLVTKIVIEKFGLNQMWSGVVMALDNVFALMLIPFFGSLSDKSNHKRGRRTPFIIVGTIIAAFAFMFLTYSDNVQESKIEASGSSIVEYYNEIYRSEDDLSVLQWMNITDGIEAEWLSLKNEGTISAEKYDLVMGDIYTYSTISGDKTIDPDEIFLDDDINEDELVLLKTLFSQHANERAWVVTTQSPGTFIIFLGTLFIALLAMSTFRSPAVALMPDVTVKPLRSKGNAIINLMGSVGALIALGIIMFYGLDRYSYVSYTPAFITISVAMLIILSIFLWKVREPKLVQDKMAEDIRLNLVEAEDDDLENMSEKDKALSKSKNHALILILVSVTLWFFGYNAVTTKISDYAPNVLEIGYAVPLYIAYGSALLAFVPIGLLATRIGRKKTIMIGIILLTFSFASVYFLQPDTASFMYFIFGLTGIAWATINVNSYPMVVELAKGSNVGKYTGYYYTFSMGAQIITPVFSGFLMDLFNTRKILFPYAALFVALSFITMSFVKHGDIKVTKKGSIIENFDVDMD